MHDCFGWRGEGKERGCSEETISGGGNEDRWMNGHRLDAAILLGNYIEPNKDQI